MYKIYLDTSERLTKKVSLIDQNNASVVEELIGDLDIVSTIATLLKKYNLKISDVSEITPFLGPGSFTGLKMGVTVANVFNWLQGKKTLENLAYPEYGKEPNITVKKEL